MLQQTLCFSVLGDRYRHINIFELFLFHMSVLLSPILSQSLKISTVHYQCFIFLYNIYPGRNRKTVLFSNKYDHKTNKDIKNFY